MAYNQSERFQYFNERFRIFDPGAYQYPYRPLIHPNKVSFLSKSRRETTFTKIWTHTLYFPEKNVNIPNCTSIKSKVPRFSYDVEKPKVVKEILCDCDSDKKKCTCLEKQKSKGEKEEPQICQGKIRRRLFTGPVRDYSIMRGAKPLIDVPFYETRVQEFSTFYQGCKWSRRTSSRDIKISEQSPGPAMYNLEQSTDVTKICSEKVRTKRRKTSQQLRYIDIVQKKTLRDNHPGPASYSPILPERKDFRCLTSQKHKYLLKSKSACLATLARGNPGPADYYISRNFDVKTVSRTQCHAKLSSPAPFGVKGVRFKHRTQVGPSPASYFTNNLNLYWKVCNRAPFGSSSKRFEDNYLLDNYLTEGSDDPEINENPKCVPKSDPSTWQFRSKLIRMASPKLIFTGTYKNLMNYNSRRPRNMQYLSPFHSSEGRFRDWYNWIPVYRSAKTPDPAGYCTEKPKLRRIALGGTINRERRFVPNRSETPAPNQYFIINGIENYVLHTHNFKLRKNIRK